MRGLQVREIIGYRREKRDMAFYRRGKGKGFDHRGPAVPPPKAYEPVRRTQKPLGYEDIEAASQAADESPEFLAFVTEKLNMPATMAPAVRDAIGQQKWKISPNPLAQVRTAAWQAARRMGLPVPNLPAPV
jgi:hypothetical protein